MAVTLQSIIIPPTQATVVTVIGTRITVEEPDTAIILGSPVETVVAIDVSDIVDVLDQPEPFVVIDVAAEPFVVIDYTTAPVTETINSLATVTLIEEGDFETVVILVPPTAISILVEVAPYLPRWLLITGVWNDAGIWLDGHNWNDG